MTVICLDAESGMFSLFSDLFLLCVRPRMNVIFHELKCKLREKISDLFDNE